MNPSSPSQQKGKQEARNAAAAGTRPQNSQPGSLVHPTENDIILGRGVLHATHPGNVRFYQIIDAHIPGRLIFWGRFSSCIGGVMPKGRSQPWSFIAPCGAFVLSLSCET